MILGESLPKDLKGDRFRFDDPEFEIEGLVARSEGSLLYLQAKNGNWAQAAAEDIYTIPNEIRKTFGRNIAEGDGDNVSLLYVPRIGGIIMFHIGIMPPEKKLRETMYENEHFIGIPGTRISSPLMRPGQTLEVRISDELTKGEIYTAQADGTPLTYDE